MSTDDEDIAGAPTPDEQFLRGETSSLSPFASPDAVLHEEPGYFPWYDTGVAGTRLAYFSAWFGGYDALQMEVREPFFALLDQYNSGASDDAVPEPFDSLTYALFLAVRTDRFSEGTIASYGTALARVANEIRRRILEERAGGESEPADAAVPEYVAHRLRQPPPRGCAVVPGSTPVVAFGDPHRAQAATLGLNPSRVEFSGGNGVLLEGPLRRLATLTQLEVPDLAHADDTTLARVVGASRRYFWRRPYNFWFRRLDTLLRSLPYSPSYYTGMACHLDLAQWATDPVWGQLTHAQRDALLHDGIPFLGEQIKASVNLRWILVNGSGAQRWVQRALGIAFEGVGGVKGTNTQISVGKYEDRPVLAWSTNLQSSRGVTITQRDTLAVKVAELLEDGW